MKRHFKIILVLFLLAIAFRVIPGPRTIDDAYITFRYARNLLDGNGFVYNAGEQVQGTTTPLYSGLMTTLGALMGGKDAPFPEIAWIVNMLSDAFTCILLFLLGRRLGKPVTGIVTAVLWAIAPYSVTFAIGGLETSLYVFLLTASVAAYIDRRRVLTALLSIFCILTRPDAILLVIPLMIDRLYCAYTRKERITPAELIVFLLPGITWGIFSSLYFGSPIPHSVQAKLEVYYLEPLSSFIRLIQHYSLLFMQDNVLGTIAGIAAGLVLIPLLFSIGAHYAWKIEKRLIPWILYPWIYLIVFSLPNPLLFRWYLTPPLPSLFFFTILGAEVFVARLSNRVPQRGFITGFRNSLLFMLAVLPAVFLMADWRLHPDHGNDQPAPAMAWIKLELLYQRAAGLIAPFMDENTILAAGDVGVLGYFTPARILDTVGLNSPQSLQYYPIDTQAYVINYAIPTELMIQEEPDWIVILEVYGRHTFLEDERFKTQYRLWEELPTDIYGSNGMLIFKKTIPDP